MFWQEAVSRFFWFTLKCSDFAVFISRRLPCIAENIMNRPEKPVTVQLVCVKKLFIEIYMRCFM